MSNVSVECGRKEALKDVLLNPTKQWAIRRIFKSSLSSLMLPYLADWNVASKTPHYISGIAGITNANIKDAVKDNFDAYSIGMEDYEADAEQRRMNSFLIRYLAWEKRQQDSAIIGLDETGKFKFAGKDHQFKVDALIVRKNDKGIFDHIEAIKYSYSKPDKSEKNILDALGANPKPGKKSAKALASDVNMAKKMLFLQLAGEKLASDCGINVKNIPVYASYYYMKARNETRLALHGAFAVNDALDPKEEENIVTFCFLPQDKRNLEGVVVTTPPDVNDTCDEEDCEECYLKDVCHAEFIPHKLEEEEIVACGTIDQLHFSPSQQQFINTTSGVIRVNAVAGSGKTAALCARLLGILENGCNAEDNLLITFTKKACDEMRARLKAFAEGDALKDEELDIENVEVETFNSWGQKILDKNFALLGYASAPTLIDEAMKIEIINKLISKHVHLPEEDYDRCNPAMKSKYVQGSAVLLMKLIDTMKSNHVETPDDVKNCLGKYARQTALTQEYLDIYHEYNEELRLNGWIDYEDQLRLLMDLKNQNVFEQMKYKHITVDEFQDSDPNQIAIICEISKRCKSIESIAVVGDELQAIYGFRDATPENIVQFQKYFPDVQDIPLVENYRSENPVITLANKIVEKISSFSTKIVCKKQEKGVDPVIQEIKTDEEEIDLYVKTADKLINVRGCKPSSIAILARTKRELLKYQQAFDKAGIPTVLKVPKILGEQPYVKAILAFASFLKDENSKADFALYVKSLGHDPFDLTALDNDANTILNAVAALPSEEAKIAFFFESIKHCREDYCGDAFAVSLETKGFHTLKQILDYCDKYKLYNIQEGISSSREDSDCVNLITVHSAKGLEWDNVFLSLKQFKQDREEERLLYVAVTRARQRILITHKTKQYYLVSLMK